MPKFTFKKEPQQTGLSGVGFPHPNTVIKLDRKMVGEITAPNYTTPDNLWRISFRVDKPVTREEPADFKWMTLKAKFEDETEARLWLNENFQEILNKHKLKPDNE
jgi:hypothetical protein